MTRIRPARSTSDASQERHRNSLHISSMISRTALFRKKDRTIEPQAVIDLRNRVGVDVAYQIDVRGGPGLTRPA